MTLQANKLAKFLPGQISKAVLGVETEDLLDIS